MSDKCPTRESPLRPRTGGGCNPVNVCLEVNRDMPSMPVLATASERPTPREWLTPGQAAAVSGISTKHLARLADAGTITAERDGDGPRRYLASSVRGHNARELLERYAVPATTVFTVLAEADEAIAADVAVANDPATSEDEREIARAVARCGTAMLARMRAGLGMPGVAAA